MCLKNYLLDKHYTISSENDYSIHIHDLLYLSLSNGSFPNYQLSFILLLISKSARGNIRERLGNASSPTPASRGRGHGRSRGTNNSDSRQKPSNRKPVTYDDLDADLDAYMAIDDVSIYDKRNFFFIFYKVLILILQGLGTGQNTSKILSGENGMDL